MPHATRPLVLLGGGHAHIEVLRRAARRPFPVPVLLVEPHPVLPYTGMVPGYVAGHYALRDILVDLDRLCAHAGATRIGARACALDAAARTVSCDDGRVLPYELLSIDIGSTLALDLPGAAEHTLAVRPLWRFVERWQQRRDAIRSVAVIGAGAAGIELALAVRAAAPGVPIAVIGEAPSPLQGWPGMAAARVAAACRDRGVLLHLGTPVRSVRHDAVTLADGRAVTADTILCATGPRAPGWLQDTGLPLATDHYLAVNTTLSVADRPSIFAAGDVASIIDHPRPKAGVFAVRAASVLEHNLRAALDGRPLARYRPQRRALALLGTGNGRAIGTWGGLTFEGRWVWRWKRAIDARFVARYRT